jgi:hypothetical protein
MKPTVLVCIVVVYPNTGIPDCGDAELIITSRARRSGLHGIAEAD